ncbi:MAG: GNAT family N-acetyltransferase [Oscillospiraceae bacterium]|nr:GNAT family N-acetyltransferase [Oscillospiraceae bacterium]
MTEIYLIRHAQAEGNSYHSMQGHWDSDVTAMGRRQIDCLAERFREEKVDALYASDLYRTRLTAGAITRYHDLPMHTTKLLREIHVGRWETLFFGNVIHDEPESAYLFMYDPDRWYMEGAETYAQVADRAMEALREIVQAHPDQRVVVVSHGVTIRALLSRITGIPLKDSKRLPICRNTSISRILWDGQDFTVDYMNDYRHILPLGDYPWNRNGDLRDEPLDLDADGDYYCACYGDAWQFAHGSLRGFSSDPYLAAARQHAKSDPGTVLRFFRGDTPVGLIDMDSDRGAHAGYGWISLLYLRPEDRFQGYGSQALARAILHYQSMGRNSIRLHVAEDNTAALAFYRREGFETLSWENGSQGRLLLMERKLRHYGQV